MVEIGFREFDLVDKYNADVSFSADNIKEKIEKFMDNLKETEKQSQVIRLLNEKFKEIDKDGEIVQTMYVSGDVYKILRTFSKDFFSSGKLWTAEVVISPDLNGNIILSTEKHVKKENIK